MVIAYIKLIPVYVKRIFPAIPRELRRFRRVASRKPNIVLMYPDNPWWQYSGVYVILHIFQTMGFKITNNPKSNYHLVMNWEDCTFRRSDKQLEELCAKEKVINGRCRDISKRRVDQVFKEVFGYSPTVDPLTYRGTCVAKSNINARHDGEILECPLKEINEEFVYQRLIDNAIDDESTMDFRVPIIKRTIPFVYIKYKAITKRFGISVKGTWGETQEIFSKDEVEKILKFCERIGLDCGELDILRDNGDKKVYIIDCNSTPIIRFEGYTNKERKMLLERLGQAYEKFFEK